MKTDLLITTPAIIFLTIHLQVHYIGQAIRLAITSIA